MCITYILKLNLLKSYRFFAKVYGQLHLAHIMFMFLSLKPFIDVDVFVSANIDESWVRTRIYSKHKKQCFFKRFDDNSVAFGFVHQFFCVFSYSHCSIWERKFLIFWSGTIWPCSQYTVLLVYSSFEHTDCYNSVKECDMGECTDDKTCCHRSSARYTPLHLIGVFYHLVLVFFKSSIHKQECLPPKKHFQFYPLFLFLLGDGVLTAY